jgi:hypothetical protein
MVFSWASVDGDKDLGDMIQTTPLVLMAMEE